MLLMVAVPRGCVLVLVLCLLARLRAFVVVASTLLHLACTQGRCLFGQVQQQHWCRNATSNSATPSKLSVCLSV